LLPRRLRINPADRIAAAMVSAALAPARGEHSVAPRTWLVERAAAPATAPVGARSRAMTCYGETSSRASALLQILVQSSSSASTRRPLPTL
ncbi:hypothetical protein, partial [Pseudomonas viridiflava]|uniref:hypothetical protein n=1 Tax=Pseudomonas viridiflava TaxID=33069 RepID=UPI001980055F